MDIGMSEYFKKAVVEIQNIFSEACDVRLEEYDKSRKEIVVSFLKPRDSSSPVVFQKNEMLKCERVYKIVEFDSNQNVSRVRHSRRRR